MKKISLFLFSCLVSIGTLLLYNIPFFNYVADNSNESAGGRLLLLASLVVVIGESARKANFQLYGYRRYKPDSQLPAVLEQHYVFHSVLNLLSIQSPAYDEAFDVFLK